MESRRAITNVASARDAIARITRNHETLGAAFAIAENLAVTAFHCVGNVDTGEVDVPNVHLRFLSGGESDAVVQASHRDGDFAVLKSTTPFPDGVKTIPLVRTQLEEIEWRSWGFPGEMETLADGIKITGKLDDSHAVAHLTNEPLLQLSVNQQGGLSLRGMSGAPVVVDTKHCIGAAGIISRTKTAVDYEDSSPLGGIVFASASAVLFEKVTWLRRFFGGEPASHEIAESVRIFADRGELPDAPEIVANASIPTAEWRPSPSPEPEIDPSIKAKVHTGDVIFVRFNDHWVSGKWKDPVATEILGVEDKSIGTVRGVYPNTAAMCIPGFDVDVEWREASYVWSAPWGPLKRIIALRFVREYSGLVAKCRVVRAMTEKGVRKLRVTNQDYDRFLRFNWPYFKGLESAFARNSLSRNEHAQRLAREDMLLPLVDRLIALNLLEQLVPERFKEMSANRRYNAQDAALMLDGMIRRSVNSNLASARPGFQVT